MIPAKTHGAISWTELMTSDADAALAFYGKIMPWTAHPMEMESGTYYLQMIGELPAAGIVQHPEEGTPTYWGLNITVDDVDAALEKAVELGGSKVWGPMDFPGVGRAGGIMDPQGGYVALINYSASSDETPEQDFMSGFTTPGRFSWFGLATTDVDAAKQFYGDLLGWEFRVDQMPTGPYVTAVVEGIGQAGITKRMSEDAPVAWAAYVTVEDCDGTVAKAQEHGGSVLAPPFDVPTVGRIAALQDPTGGAFFVVKYVPMEELEGG